MPSCGSVRNVGLDLVRAIAVSLVLICHGSGIFCYWLGVPWPPHLALTGLFGVELFFALSGFLIGQLLFEVAERDPSVRGWWRFMVRRWMRTIPAYALCLVAFALLWPSPGQSVEHLANYATFTQNLLWPMPADNWFGVSWSLSVEEWFYLLFSASLMLAVGLAGRHRNACIWIVLSLFVVVPAILRWQVPDSAGWDNHLRKVAFLRLDAIAYGVIVAKLYRQGSTFVGRPGLPFAIGAAVILEVWFQPLSLAWVPQHAMRTFELTIIPLAFAFCLPAATQIRCLPGLGGIVYRLSLQSYSLYLLHRTVLLAIDAARPAYHLSVAECVLLSIALIAALSTGVTKWVELPVMALRPRQHPFRPGPITRRAQGPSYTVLSSRLKSTGGVNENA